MTLEQQRAYVKAWEETGRMLEEIRWREVAALDSHIAWRDSEELMEMALAVPLPAARWNSSGLVAQQALFHRRTP